MLAERKFKTGETSVAALRREMKVLLADRGIQDIQYIAFLTDSTVEEVSTIVGPTVVAIAVRVGRARLIDNLLIG